MKLSYTPPLKKVSLILALIAVLLCLSAVIATWALTFHPKQIQNELVYNSADVPILKAGQRIKVMSWNVQYMAGKNYVFFYDVPNGDGPDSMPSKQDVAMTVKEVARIIKEEDPDILLLQEMDSGAKRTYYENQLSVLMQLLPGHYKSYCSTYYWKNRFNPHRKIMGSTGLSLAIISKYKISEATRHRLTTIEGSRIFKDFNLKRAVLKARLPVQGGKDLFAVNTHLSAFSQKTDTMSLQITELIALLNPLENNKYAWFIGGDFNLLPPGRYETLIERGRCYYRPETELSLLIEKYPCVPRIEDLQGEASAKWYTHFSNDPEFTEPDRTIDYIFHSKFLDRAYDYHVRNEDTRHISDHFPIISGFKIP